MEKFRAGAETVEDEPGESSSARNEGNAQETKGQKNVKRTQNFPMATGGKIQAKKLIMQYWILIQSVK